MTLLISLLLLCLAGLLALQHRSTDAEPRLGAGRWLSRVCPALDPPPPLPRAAGVVGVAATTSAGPLPRRARR